MLTKINFLLVSFILQFTVSMLGLQLAPPKVNICGKHNGRGNSEIRKLRILLIITLFKVGVQT